MAKGWGLSRKVFDLLMISNTLMWICVAFKRPTLFQVTLKVCCWSGSAYFDSCSRGVSWLVSHSLGATCSLVFTDPVGKLCVLNYPCEVVRARLNRMSAEVTNMAAELCAEELQSALDQYIACVTSPDGRTLMMNEDICREFCHDRKELVRSSGEDCCYG